MSKIHVGYSGVADVVVAVVKIGVACYMIGNAIRMAKESRKQQGINDKYYNGQKPIYTDFVESKEGA